MYVLTGARATDSLDEIESQLLSGFRKLDQRGKSGVLALIDGLTPAKGTPLSVFNAEVNQVINGNLTTESQHFTMGTKKSKK